MSAPQTNPPPVDKQQITLTSAGVILLLTFGLGGAWRDHEVRIAQLEKAHADERQERVATTKLLNRICAKIGCDKEGMRE